MSDDDNKIVELPKRPTELRPKGDVPFTLVVNRTGNYCQHARRVVDDNRRSVTCRDCKASLDPFSVLVEVARDNDRFTRNFATLQTEISAAESRLKLLERLESNARSRAKRLGVRGSKVHFDDVIRYARECVRRDVRPDLIEYTIDHADPVARVAQGLEALKDRHAKAALYLLRQAVDELEAGLELAEEERAHG